MRTMNFDAVAASTPLNRDASTVRDGSGDIYDKPAGGFEQVNRWIAPPPLMSERKMSRNGIEAVRAMVGRRFGAFVLLGVWADSNPKKNATWVCRCDCGYYEGRRLKGLTSLGETACCSHCAQTRRLRAMASAPNTKAARHSSEAMLDALSASKRAGGSQ